MYYIKLLINGECKYLYNRRMAVHNVEFARPFTSRVAAHKYMRRKNVMWVCEWRVVER